MKDYQKVAIETDKKQVIDRKEGEDGRWKIDRAKYKTGNKRNINRKAKENFVLELFHYFKYSFRCSLGKYFFNI